MSTSFAFKPIITDGLVFVLDAANKNSFISGNTTCYDLSGNNYNGTISSGVTYNSNNGGFFTFNGTNGNISFGTNTPKLYPRTDNYTWCGWLKFDSLSGARQIWYGNAGGGNDGVGILLDKTGSTNRIFIEILGTLNGRQFKYITTNSYLNTWNYWCFVLDATTFTRTIYVNGIELASDVILNWGNLRQEPSAGVNGIYIGGYNGIQWFYDGSISNIMVYNKALSSNEVKQNYNALKFRHQ
jgi:hypothetical protein